MSQPKSKKWPELGVITKNVKKDKDGNVVKDASGNPITTLAFKLAENVTVLVDGQPVALNKYRSGILTSPVDDVENMYKNGVIGDDKIEERREAAKSTHTWLRYKVTLPPPRTT